MRTIHIDKSLQGLRGLSERNDIMKQSITAADGSKITTVFQQDQKKGLEGLKQKLSNFINGIKPAKESVSLALAFDKVGIGENSQEFKHIRKPNEIFAQNRIKHLSDMIKTDDLGNGIGNLQFVDRQNTEKS